MAKKSKSGGSAFPVTRDNPGTVAGTTPTKTVNPRVTKNQEKRQKINKLDTRLDVLDLSTWEASNPAPKRRDFKNTRDFLNARLKWQKQRSKAAKAIDAGGNGDGTGLVTDAGADAGLLKGTNFYDKAADLAVKMGPAGYNDFMNANLGLNNPTIGYGADPASFRSGMTGALDGSTVGPFDYAPKAYTSPADRGFSNVGALAAGGTGMFAGTGGAIGNNLPGGNVGNSTLFNPTGTNLGGGTGTPGIGGGTGGTGGPGTTPYAPDLGDPRLPKPVTDWTPDAMTRYRGKGKMDNNQLRAVIADLRGQNSWVDSKGVGTGAYADFVRSNPTPKKGQFDNKNDYLTAVARWEQGRERILNSSNPDTWDGGKGLAAGLSGGTVGPVAADLGVTKLPNVSATPAFIPKPAMNTGGGGNKPAAEAVNPFAGMGRK